MVKPKNVTISTSSDKNLCSKTHMPFEEPDGMTDIDLHEIISCQSTSDTKSITKYGKRNVPKLLFTIGIGFMIIICIVLTLFLVDDSLPWLMPPNHAQQTNTNFQKSLTLNELPTKNEKANMNEFESAKQNDINEFPNNQHNRIKRDISWLDMNNLQAADSRLNEPHENLTFLNIASNENAIEDDSLEWQNSGKSDKSKAYKRKLSSYYNNHDAAAETITTTENSLKQNGSSENQPVSSSLNTDTSEFSHETIFTSASAVRENDYTVENYGRATNFHEPRHPTTHASWNSDSEEDGDHKRVLTTTPIFSPKSPYELTSKFDNWENKNGPGLTEPPIHNFEKKETDILSASTTSSHTTTSLFPSSENENQSDATRIGDGNLEEDREYGTEASVESQENAHDFTSTLVNWQNKTVLDLKQPPIHNFIEIVKDVPPTSTTATYDTIPSSTPIYSQELTDDFTSTVANRENKNEFGVKELSSDDLEEIENDFFASSTTVAHETTSVVSTSDDENQSEVTTTWDDNSPKDRDHERIPLSTLIYSQELTDDITSTVANWENKNEYGVQELPSNNLEETENDFLASSTTVTHETTSVVSSSDDENQSEATTWDGNSAKDLDHGRIPLSTPIYSQELTDDFRSTVADWENKNEFGVQEPLSDNLEEIENDILPSSTTVVHETTSVSNTEDENQSEATTTWDDNLAEDGDHGRVLSSSPIYSQELTDEFTSTLANWENKNEFGVQQLPSDNLEEISNDILPSSTTVVHETTSVVSNTEVENQSEATTTWDDNSAEDRDHGRVLSSSPIYSQELTDEFTSTVANWDNKNEYSVKESPSDNLEEIENDFLPSSTTVAHETTSVVSSSEDENQSDATRTRDDKSAEDRGYRHISSSTSVYSQELTQDFTSTVANTEDENQSKATTTWDDNSGEDGDHGRILSSTNIYSQELTDEFTSTVANWENKNEFGVQELPSDNLEKIENDILPSSTTVVHETTSVVSNTEVENQSEATTTWDDNSAEDGDHGRILSSTNIYSQELTDEFTSTVANWENTNEFRVKELPSDNLEEIANDILPSSTTVAYETTSLVSNTEDENQSEATTTWEDNTAEDGDHGRIPLSTPVYSQELTGEFTSTIANWENENKFVVQQHPSDNLEEIANDILPSSITVAHESTYVVSNTEDENQSEVTTTWDDNSVEHGDHWRIPLSTPIYSQELTDDFTSTVVNWENKNEFGVQEIPPDNLEEIANDILLSLTTVAQETTSAVFNTEDENQSEVTTTWDDNLVEDRDLGRIPLSTPIYSQELTHEFTSTVANWENKNEFGVEQLPSDNLEEIANDILPPSTTVVHESTSVVSNTEDENQSEATTTWDDNSAEDGDHGRNPLSTPIYSKELTDAFTSTIAYWENQNKFVVQELPSGNLEEIANDFLPSSTTVVHETTSVVFNTEDENQPEATTTWGDNTAEDGDHGRIPLSTPVYSQELADEFTSTLVNWEKKNEFGEQELPSRNFEEIANDLLPSSTTVARETTSVVNTEDENQSEATTRWGDNSAEYGDQGRIHSSTPIHSQELADEFTSTVANWENKNEIGVKDLPADDLEEIENDFLPSSTTVAHETTSVVSNTEDENQSEATTTWDDNSAEDGDHGRIHSSTPIYSQELTDEFTSTVVNWDNKNEYSVKERPSDDLQGIENDFLPSSTAVAHESTSAVSSSEDENESDATRIRDDKSAEDRGYRHIPSSMSVYSQELTQDFTSTVSNWENMNEFGVTEPPTDKLEVIGNVILPSSTTGAHETTSLFSSGADENQSDATRTREDNLAEDLYFGHILPSTPIYSQELTDDFTPAFQNWENNNGFGLKEPKSEGNRYELTSTMSSGDFFSITDRTSSKMGNHTFTPSIENIYDSYEESSKTSYDTGSNEIENQGGSKLMYTNNLYEENNFKSAPTSTISDFYSSINEIPSEAYETVDVSSSTTINVVSDERTINTNMKEDAYNQPMSLPPFNSDFHIFTTTIDSVSYGTENINDRWYKNKNSYENKLESTAVGFDVFESANNDLDSYERTKSSTNNYFNERSNEEDGFPAINVKPVSDGHSITNIIDNHESEGLVPSVNYFSNDIDKYQLELPTVINSLGPDQRTDNVESTTYSYNNVRPFIPNENAVPKYITSRLSRFNRKASALRNRTELLTQNSKGLAKNFNHEAAFRVIATTFPTAARTTENNLDSTSLPLNVRWSGQDTNNFENMKISGKDFATVNEHLQSNQQSSVNQNFGKAACPTFISPMGFPVLQQPSAFPYIYNSNQASPYTNVMPFPIPRAETNPYMAQQYPYVGTNAVPSYSRAMMQQSGYLMYNVNGQNVITPSGGGQYYICNPVPNVLGNSNTDGIPQVEIRKSVNDNNLQSFASENLENRTRASRDCPFGERSCEDDSKCIKTHNFCDGEVQCKDASDEAFCPCKSRIGKARECDGYFDCPNGEDESKCFGCEADMFSCDDWSQNDRTATCIPAEQRCDGIPQCPTEKDEHDCSILTGTFSKKQHFIVSTTVGFLYRNFKGRWYPACRNPESWANEACQSAAGPSTMAPLTHLVPVDDNYNGPYISASSKEDIKISNSCEPGAAIFVECPPLVCGMRKRIRNPYRSEEVDTSAERILSQFLIRKEPTEFNHTTDSILGDGRVVGGKPSQAEAWPWIVSVYRNGVFHCGGALINELWIVTAGHCVEKYWHYYYEVQAGVLRRYSYAPMVQNRMISHIIGHRLYDRTKLKNDLALMKLSKPLHFGRYVRPICLPSEITAGKNFKWGPEPGTICTAVGWGATVEHGSDPDHLREVEVPILDHCKHLEDKEGNEICAGLMEGGKDACQGDSGGPFMCRNPNAPNQWYLAGIVSHGEGCARPNEPGVYTRVSLFLEWIYENIRAEMVPQTRPLHRCPGYICRKTNRCIANKRRCNKVVDCLLGDDEMHCDKNGFNEIFKHAMRHMFLRSDQDDMDNNATTNSPTTQPNEKETTLSVLTQTNDPNTDNLENTSDVTEASTTVQATSPDPIPSNQSYNKNFVCKRILQTIDISKQCDKTVDCEDATDEENCPCVSYLRNFHPQAICDGVTDCLDMTDETNCHVCKQNEYHCRQSNVCIIKEKRCNNVPDCPWEEDEWDCFALTNGKTITLDGDLRPFLNDSGLVSFNHNGTWRPVCNNWVGGIEAAMAADTCFYLGFSDYKSFLKVPVYDNPLQIMHKSASVMADTLPAGNRCTALFIKCSDVIDVTHLTDHANISKVINTMQGNPWNAEIYVNGKFKCTGSILDVDWIITSTNCFEKDFKLHNKFVAVLLGRSKTYLNVMGPHEQVIRIIGSIQVSDSDIILLRLSNRINVSRYIRPIRFSVRDYIVSEKETCIALGRNLDNSTESIILQAVTNCTFGFRCFKRSSPVQEFCQNKSFTSWSGSIVCQSKHGWYPAAVFNESRGSCGFTTTAAYTSVQYWRANILKLMEQTAAVVVDAPVCKGFRCSLGRCLEEHNICDGIPDCRDAGDEDPSYCSEKRKQCSASSSCVCLKSELKCQNGKCVPKTAFCDTNNDCGDWSDEPESCNCRSYLALTNPEMICDGIRNCHDRTDEDPHLCSCKGYHFVCGESNHCVPQDMVCDGVSDCPNGHDESHCIALISTPGRPSTEVQVRTAGIWHPGCFPKFLTTSQLESICEKIGYTGRSAVRINTGNNWNTGWRPVTEPFLGILIYHPKRYIIIAIRPGDKPFVSLKSDLNCYRLFLECS